ncbi:hypothetical protein HOF26_02365 [bacterium]|nr:hypothetical protein [bacterium]
MLKRFLNTMLLFLTAVSIPAFSMATGNDSDNETQSPVYSDMLDFPRSGQSSSSDNSDKSLDRVGTFGEVIAGLRNLIPWRKVAKSDSKKEATQTSDDGNAQKLKNIKQKIEAIIVQYERASQLWEDRIETITTKLKKTQSNLNVLKTAKNKKNVLLEQDLQEKIEKLKKAKFTTERLQKANENQQQKLEKQLENIIELKAKISDLPSVKDIRMLDEKLTAVNDLLKKSSVELDKYKNYSDKLKNFLIREFEKKCVVSLRNKAFIWWRKFAAKNKLEEQKRLQATIPSVPDLSVDIAEEEVAELKIKVKQNELDMAWLRKQRRLDPILRKYLYVDKNGNKNSVLKQFYLDAEMGQQIERNLIIGAYQTVPRRTRPFAVWALRCLSNNWYSNKPFLQGTFSLNQHGDNVIEDFFNKFVADPSSSKGYGRLSYDRPSTHYKEQKGVQHKGIDNRLLEKESAEKFIAGQTHWLMVNRGDDGDQHMLTIKPEDYGLGWDQFLSHGGTTAISLLRKLPKVGKYFGSDDGKGNQKERVQKAFLIIFGEMLKALYPKQDDMQDLHMNAANKLGVSYMYSVTKTLKKDAENKPKEETVSDLSSSWGTVTKADAKIAACEGMLECFDALVEHVEPKKRDAYLRMLKGNEVIHVCETRKKLIEENKARDLKMEPLKKALKLRLSKWKQDTISSFYTTYGLDKDSPTINNIHRKNDIVKHAFDVLDTLSLIRGWGVVCPSTIIGSKLLGKVAKKDGQGSDELKAACRSVEKTFMKSVLDPTIEDMRRIGMTVIRRKEMPQEFKNIEDQALSYYELGAKYNKNSAVELKKSAVYRDIGFAKNWPGYFAYGWNRADALLGYISQCDKTLAEDYANLVDTQGPMGDKWMEIAEAVGRFDGRNSKRKLKQHKK